MHDIGHWQHVHEFTTGAEHQAERRTRWVVLLTVVTMVVELTTGWLTGSMALLADGWHMGSHAAALGMSAFAYAFARKRRKDRAFTFGTGKVSTLAGYTSAMLLAGGALWMFVESVTRLMEPVAIRYSEALVVAALGLVVNLASARILTLDSHSSDDPHHPHHPHHHDHHGHHHHQDHNLKSAYLHVLADAASSVLALVALGLGMLYGWAFLDPTMGVLGALLIGRWAFGLASESARVLLDAEDHGDLISQVQEVIAHVEDTELVDLHVWRIGPAGCACIVSVVTHEPRSVGQYRAILGQVHGIVHWTIEVNQCTSTSCRPASERLPCDPAAPADQPAPR